MLHDPRVLARVQRGAQVKRFADQLITDVLAIAIAGVLFHIIVMLR